MATRWGLPRIWFDQEVFIMRRIATRNSLFPMEVTILRSVGFGGPSDYVLKDVTDLYDLLDRQPKVENGVIVEGGVTNIMCNVCNDDGQYCPDMMFAFPSDFQPIYGAVGDEHIPDPEPMDW